MKDKIINQLEEQALKLRQKTFQAFIDKKEAHLGGSFSIVKLSYVYIIKY